MVDQAVENYTAFRQVMPELLKEHRGQHALLHDGSIMAYYQTSLDAIKEGLWRFGEENFTVELVDDAVEDLGFYSHVSAALQA